MRDGAVIGPIIIAIGLIVAALCFAVVGALLQTADGRIPSLASLAATKPSTGLANDWPGGSSDRPSLPGCPASGTQNSSS